MFADACAFCGAYGLMDYVYQAVVDCGCVWMCMVAWIVWIVSSCFVTSLCVYLVRPNQGEYVDLVLIHINIYISGYPFMVGLSSVQEAFTVLSEKPCEFCLKTMVTYSHVTLQTSQGKMTSLRQI